MRANLGVDAPVYVQIIGLPGQMTDAPAFYKYLRVRATGSIGKPIDLGGLELGAGVYKISAEGRGRTQNKPR